MKKIILLSFFFLFIFCTCYAQTYVELDKKAYEKSKKGNFKEAVQLYDEAIKIAPNEKQLYVSRIYCIYAMGNNDEVEKNISLFITQFADDWKAYSLVCDYYRDVKEFYKALEFARLMVIKFENAPDSTQIQAHILQGNAKYDLLDFEGTKEDYLWAYEHDTGSTQNMFAMARIYNALAKFDSANYFYNKIINIEPACINCYNAMGFNYNGAGKYEEAITFFKKAFEIIKKAKFSLDEMDVGLLYSNYGFALAKLGKYKDALKSFESSIEYFPTNSYVYKNRALVYIQQNKLKEACIDLYRAISLGFSDQYGTEVEKMIATYCR